MQTLPPNLPPRGPSKRRAALALAVAAVADIVPVALAPLAFGFLDEIVDVIAMALTTLLIGFHPLLLPTFVIEVLPGVDVFPTWTACVTSVLWLRRRKE
jgi:hypothetical protein